jgi:AraC-like DNA-binding protein
VHDLLALPPRIVQINRYPFRAGEEIAPSWSASLHLVHVLHGSGQVSIGGEWHQLHPGEVAALPWGRAWAFSAASRDPLAIISIHLRFLSWEQPDRQDRPAHGLVASGATAPEAGPAPILPAVQRPRDARRSRALAEACLDAWHARDAARALRLRGLAVALVADLLPDTRPAARHAQAGRIDGLLEWLGYHPEAMPSRGELEARAGLRQTAFGAAFRSVTGRSPAAWLMERRLGEAHRLLTTTRDSIAVIAARVGFGDPFHFSRRFRARFGASPRQVRAEPW